LPSTARSVPERCGRLVWRRARPCESHAHESYQPDQSYDPEQSYDPCESYAPHAYEPNEPNEPALVVDVRRWVVVGKP
jgi:hypothetical protein